MFYRLDFDFASDTIMEYPCLVGPGEGHRSRAQNPQPEILNALDRDNADLKNTIVRLQFMFGGTTRHGTGFFVNLPSPTFDVILTAAHNLIDVNKVLASNLMVIYADGGAELATDFQICPQYVEILGTRPKSDERAKFDYGVILLPKDEKIKAKRQGLGLSLEIDSNDTLRSPKEVRVYGYGETGTGSYLRSSGPLKDVPDRRQLEYKVQTEPGMSGSPVWIPYGGQRIAVGIHNMRPKNSGSGSRGARITAEVFRNLCDWAQVGFFNRRLCVVGKDPDGQPTHNTYLAFYQDYPFAKVFLGSSAAASAQDNLSFDILPAIIPPSWAVKSSPLWAFRFHRPLGWRKTKGDEEGDRNGDKTKDGKGDEDGDNDKCWVEWRPSRQEAVLVKKLKEVNLVRLQEIQKSGRKRSWVTAKSGQKPFRVILPRENETDNQQLRLDDGERDEDDIDHGLTDFEGVLFAEQGDDGANGKGLFMIE
ncbi:hypothetical protein TgHK011_005303 [Trichoderma gracile]|nr:hypothetical protein TgHK011_005303 [Trichoderma gracile]